MNRYRLNQILEVLLFPATDPKLGKQDVLLSFYRAYQEIAKLDAQRMPGEARRDEALRKYRKRRRELVDYLTERCHGKIKSEDDILMLCKLYHPMEEIQQEMTYIAKKRQKKNYKDIPEESISLYYLKKLASVADSLITYRDGTAAIRSWTDHAESADSDIFNKNSGYNKVEIWNLLCRITVPDLYIVMSAVDKGFGMEALYEQKSYIALADKLLNKVLQKGVAENHMHFNVGMDYEAVWLHYTDLKFLEYQDAATWSREEYERLEISVFRLLAACYIEYGEFEEGLDEWLHQHQPEQITSLVHAMMHGDVAERVPAECIANIRRMYQKLIITEPVRKGDYLLAIVYEKYLEYQVSSEFIFLYQAYRYLAGNETDTFFARVFLQYIRMKNDYFSDRQERNVLQGLGYFRRKYREMKMSALAVMRKPDAMLESFRFQAKIDCLRKLEIRVAPNVQMSDIRSVDPGKTQKIIQSALYDQIYEILYAYRRYLLECLKGVRWTWVFLKREEIKSSLKMEIRNLIQECENGPYPSVPQPGVVFHFLKTDQTEDAFDSRCFRDVRDDDRRNMPARMMRRYMAANIAKSLEAIRSAIPGLDEYVVGIDAASEENIMEPWIFSQAYQQMRSHLVTKPILKISNGKEEFHRIQNIGFTYHVGEEFRHIVSGFRHTDEVLERFGYRAGDRLGHALVLGIDVEQWVTENEMVPVSKIEHLENLLWMWGVNTCEEFHLPVRLEILEDRIMNIVKNIYPNPQTITIKMLYEAYEMKFGPDHALIARKVNQKTEAVMARAKKTEGKNAEADKADSDRIANCEECEEQFWSEWDSEKLLMTNYCPGIIRKCEQIDLVPVNREEIEVYQMLQDYMIYKVKQKGVYLEMNPTSNLTIGDFPQIRNHPIFKLNALQRNDRNHVMLTINSDNPAVFSTNVENEMAYIYYAAEEFGSSRSEILEWIDHIRQQGMDASFIKQEKNLPQILSEIQEMMELIKKRKL